MKTLPQREFHSLTTSCNSDMNVDHKTRVTASMFTPESNWRLTTGHKKTHFLFTVVQIKTLWSFTIKSDSNKYTETVCVWNTSVKRHTQNREQGQVIYTHTHTHSDICWCSANSEVLEVRRQRPLLWLTGCHHQEIKQQNPDNNTHNNHQADWVRVTLSLSYTHTQYIDTQCTAQMSSWVTKCFYIWMCCQCSASIDEHLLIQCFQVFP